MATATTTHRDKPALQPRKRAVVDNQPHTGLQGHFSILDGLPFKRLTDFEKKTGLARADLSRILDIPMTTMIRRQSAKRLSLDESERLLRLERVVDAATKLFRGEINTALDWLSEPSEYLNDTPPIELIRTDLGTREVESYIRRISQGIFM